MIKQIGVVWDTFGASQVDFAAAEALGKVIAGLGHGLVISGQTQTDIAEHLAETYKKNGGAVATRFILPEIRRHDSYDVVILENGIETFIDSIDCLVAGGNFGFLSLASLVLLGIEKSAQSKEEADRMDIVLVGTGPAEKTIRDVWGKGAKVACVGAAFQAKTYIK